MKKTSASYFKKWAKRISRTLQVSHNQALNYLVRECGYDCWKTFSGMQESQEPFAFLFLPPPASYHIDDLYIWFVSNHTLGFDWYYDGGDFLESPDEIVDYLDKEFFYDVHAVNLAVLQELSERVYDEGPWLRYDHFFNAAGLFDVLKAEIR